MFTSLVKLLLSWSYVKLSLKQTFVSEPELKFDNEADFFEKWYLGIRIHCRWTFAFKVKIPKFENIHQNQGKRCIFVNSYIS